MSDFKTQTASGKLNPNKRVKYSTGLVLGVDEFEQEQFFFLEQGRLHQRGLHGSGVVCGLDVTWDDSDKQINVSPGMAVDLHGRVIQVEQAQCGDPSDWFGRGVRGDKQVYVLLCYRECESDDVPVPGAPCRSEDENVAPSRITSRFELRFSDKAPNSQFETAVRDFGDVMARFQVSKTKAMGVSVERLSEALRLRYSQWPLNQATSLSGADGDGIIWLSPDEFENVMRALLALWVHEFKPALALSGAQCRVDNSEDGCVALAVVRQSERGVQVDYEQTPILLSSRMNQEYLLSRDVTATWHSDLLGLDSKEDHPQYLTLDGKRDMEGDLVMAGHAIHMQGAHITGVSEAKAEGEVLPYGQSAEGDLSGTYPAPMVRAIHGVPVVNKSNPVSHDLLVYQGGTNPRFELRKLNLGQLGNVSTTGVQLDYVLVKKEEGWKAVSQPGPVGPASGDLGGFYPDPQVTGLGGYRANLVPGAPDYGAVLMLVEGVNEVHWQPTQFTLSSLLDVKVEPALGVGVHLVFDGESWTGEVPEPMPVTLPPSGTAEGDLDGDYPNPTVTGIRNRPVDASRESVPGSVMALDTTMLIWQVRPLMMDELGDVDAPMPADGEILMWDVDAWKPKMPPQGGGGAVAGLAEGDLAGEYPAPMVTGIGGIPVVPTDLIDVGPDMGMSGDVLVMDRAMPTEAKWRLRCLSLNDLCDVDVSPYDLGMEMGDPQPGDDPAMAGMAAPMPATEDQVLIYSAGRWSPRAVSSFANGANSVNDPATGGAPPVYDPAYDPAMAGGAADPAMYADPNAAAQPGMVARTVNVADLILLKNSGKIKTVEIWFHADTVGNPVLAKGLTKEMLSIEVEVPNGGLQPLSFTAQPSKSLNVVVVDIDVTAEFADYTARMRFNFNSNMVLIAANEMTMSLAEYGRQNGVRYEGEDAAMGRVTSFMRIQGNKIV